MLKKNQMLPLLLVISPLFLISVKVEAARAGDKNIYIGTGLSLNYMNPDTSETNWIIDDSKGFGWKLYAGKNITDVLGVEVYGEDFGEAKLARNDNKAAVNYKGIGINAIYKPIAFNNTIAPFLKLGIGHISTSAKGSITTEEQNDFSIIGGIGVDYAINDNLNIRGEYGLYDEDLSQLSLGVNWSFGGEKKVQPKRIKKKSIPKAGSQPVIAIPIPQPVVNNYYKTVNNRVVREVKKIIIPKAPPKVVPRVVIKKPPIVPKIKRHTLTGGSYFASGSSLLMPNGKRAILRMVKDLRRNGYTNQYITITGHTDNVGSARNNLQLSERRAYAVANYLQILGIPRNVMTIRGMGEEQPISSNHSAAGRAENRRVEIIISAQKQYK